MVALYMSQVAPSSCINNAAFLQGADEMRRVQRGAYLAKVLSPFNLGKPRGAAIGGAAVQTGFALCGAPAAGVGISNAHEGLRQAIGMCKIMPPPIKSKSVSFSDCDILIIGITDKPD